MAKTFDLYNGDKIEQSGVTSPIDIENLKPNSQFDNYSATRAGQDLHTPLSFKTDDIKPEAPTVQVTADDGKAFVKIVAGKNEGSTLTAGKIYYTDGTTAKTMALKAGDAGTISGLTNGTEYQVQATVTNGAGESAKSAVAKVTPKTATVAVTGVSLDKSALELEVGASDTLKSTVAPANATDKAISFSSADTSIATVDAKSGKVTSVKAGTTDVTVTTHEGAKKATAKVTVVEPATPEPPTEGE